MLANIFSLLFAATTAVPAPMEPSGPWQISSDELYCQAKRDYGADTAIIIEAGLTGRANTMDVIAPKGELPVGSGDVSLAFDGVAVSMHYYDMFGNSRGLAGPKQRVISIPLQEDDAAKLAGTNTLAIGEKKRPLHLTSFQPALRALRACAAKVMTGLGLDAQQYMDRVPLKLGNPGRWFGPSNYPSAARARRATGRVVAVLGADAQGRVNECKVLIGVDPALDAATCEIAKQHSIPAPPLDAEGKPKLGFALLPVFWVVP